MKATFSVLLVLFLQSSNLVAQSESEICRRLFISAGDIAKESKLALDLAAQAVWGASEMNGNNLTLTGTLTQTNPSLDTWSYSSTPNNKLVIQFYGSIPVEIAFTSFDGWLQGTWEDFTNSHRVDFTISVGAEYDLRVQSESLPDNVDPKYTWQRQLSGILPFDGEITTANLLHSGTTTYELSSGYAYHHYQEACTGSYTNASMTTTVNDQYFATIRHNSNQGQYAVNKGILSNSSTAIGGNTYAYQSGLVQWAAYTNFPDSASAGIYNKVLDPGFWQSSGTLTKNGMHYGTLGFDRSIVADSDGPYLVLNTTSGPSYVLHPLLHPVVTGITSPEMEPPTAFELHGNFPNPFNPETQIPFELSRTSHVRLEIFDALGRRIATLVNTVLSPGRHARLWNAAEMPSGIYWYRLESDGKVQTKKMVLMK